MTEQSIGVGVPLCNLKVDERENDYAEIGEAPTSGRCKEVTGVTGEPDPNQSQSIEPPSRTMGACNELPLSQSHPETDAIDESSIEKSPGKGGCSDFAEETLPLSHKSETDANVNLVGVESDQSLQEIVVATCLKEDVLAVPRDNCDTEAASSSLTTYNAVTNFQVGPSERNTGENSCLDTNLF